MSKNCLLMWETLSSCAILHILELIPEFVYLNLIKTVFPCFIFPLLKNLKIKNIKVIRDRQVYHLRYLWLQGTEHPESVLNKNLIFSPLEKSGRRVIEGLVSSLAKQCGNSSSFCLFTHSQHAGCLCQVSLGSYAYDLNKEGGKLHMWS